MLRQTLIRAARSQPLTRRMASTSTNPAKALLTDQSANIGDYPTTVPFTNRQLRPATTKYDNQQERRNFGETVHEEDEILAVFSPDVHRHVTPSRALAHVAAVIAVIYGITMLAQASFEPLKAVRRTYPYNGTPHYSPWPYLDRRY